MDKVIQGTIRGNTIELNENPGFAEGQAVQVVVQPVGPSRPWGEGIRKSAGGLAAQWTERGRQDPRRNLPDRKRDSHREIPA